MLHFLSSDRQLFQTAKVATPGILIRELASNGGRTSDKGPPADQNLLLDDNDDDDVLLLS